VVAVDVGSVGPSSKFAWAAFDAPGRDPMAAGTDPETAVSAFVAGGADPRRAEAWRGMNLYGVQYISTTWPLSSM